MKKVFLSLTGELIIKNGSSVWIWCPQEFDGPIFVKDDYLHEQCLLPIKISKEKDLKKWNVEKYRRKIWKLLKED